jgi:hypothetical protein
MKYNYLFFIGMTFLPLIKKKKRKHIEVPKESELDEIVLSEISKEADEIEQFSDDEFEIRRTEKEKKRKIIEKTITKEEEEEEEEEEEFISTEVIDKDIDKENINILNNNMTINQTTKLSSSKRKSLQKIHNKPSELNKRKQPVFQKSKRKQVADKENIVTSNEIY